MARLPAVVINCEITLEGMTSIEFAADYSYRLSIELDHEYCVDYVRWIEKLLQTLLDDYRKFAVWRILISM